MPRTCTKQSARRYTDRPSPPYPGNQCRQGQRKLGNDGNWYVVSKPNVNGVKRWVKVKSAGSKKAAPRRSRAPAARRPRKPRVPAAARARNSNPPKRYRMYSHYDKKNLVATVYLKQPTGRYFFYDQADEYFRKLVYHDISDRTVAERIDIEDAKMLIGQGYKVWVVPYTPGEYEF